MIEGVPLWLEKHIVHWWVLVAYHWGWLDKLLVLIMLVMMNDNMVVNDILVSILMRTASNIVLMAAGDSQKTNDGWSGSMTKHSKTWPTTIYCSDRWLVASVTSEYYHRFKNKHAKSKGKNTHCSNKSLFEGLYSTACFTLFDKLTLGQGPLSFLTNMRVSSHVEVATNHISPVVHPDQLFTMLHAGSATWHVQMKHGDIWWPPRRTNSVFTMELYEVLPTTRSSLVAIGYPQGLIGFAWSRFQPEGMDNPTMTSPICAVPTVVLPQTSSFQDNLVDACWFIDQWNIALLKESELVEHNQIEQLIGYLAFSDRSNRTSTPRIVVHSAALLLVAPL